MFVDLVKITVQSGKGGNGMSSFRREKYVPKGGPSGGDGGRGGHVVFEGDEGLSTLLEFRYNRLRKAENGEHGKSKKMDGKNGKDLVLKVPVGTTIFNDETGKVLADITEHKQRATILKGGRGGRGNVKFTTSRNTAPDFAENGEPGQELNLRIELKLLADVGFVGMPNAGKSTLLSAITKAKPKIAAYPFTTLTPQLGVVGVKDGRSFVAADMPGLIQGASEGQGLGQQFLRHIERTRALLHVLDMSAFEGRDPYEDFHAINEELKAYQFGLENRPQIIVANKMDMPEAAKNLERFKERYEGDALIVPISAATRDNLELLLLKTADLLDSVEPFSLYDSSAFEEFITYRYDDKDEPFEIKKGDDGIFEIGGARIERLFSMTDFSKDQAVRRFAKQLRDLGVEQELRKLGVEPGETVRILGHEFELME